MGRAQNRAAASRDAFASVFGERRSGRGDPRTRAEHEAYLAAEHAKAFDRFQSGRTYDGDAFSSHSVTSGAFDLTLLQGSTALTPSVPAQGSEVMLYACSDGEWLREHAAVFLPADRGQQVAATLPPVVIALAYAGTNGHSYSYRTQAAASCTLAGLDAGVCFRQSSLLQQPLRDIMIAAGLLAEHDALEQAFGLLSERAVTALRTFNPDHMRWPLADISDGSQDYREGFDELVWLGLVQRDPTDPTQVCLAENGKTFAHRVYP